MSPRRESDAKTKALRRKGALNPKAQQVSDARFVQEEFFDARDLVQVKYEMLRRVRAEGHSVTEAAGAFGYSRFSFYQAQETYQQEGLPGLVPRKSGPRGRHKLTPEVLEFLEGELAKDPSLRVQDLPGLVKQHFGLAVHRRTIERALGRAKKKRR